MVGLRVLCIDTLCQTRTTLVHYWGPATMPAVPNPATLPLPETKLGTWIIYDSHIPGKYVYSSIMAIGSQCSNIGHNSIGFSPPQNGLPSQSISLISGSALCLLGNYLEQISHEGTNQALGLPGHPDQPPSFYSIRGLHRGHPPVFKPTAIFGCNYSSASPPPGVCRAEVSRETRWLDVTSTDGIKSKADYSAPPLLGLFPFPKEH